MVNHDVVGFDVSVHYPHTVAIIQGLGKRGMWITNKSLRTSEQASGPPSPESSSHSGYNQMPVGIRDQIPTSLVLTFICMKTRMVLCGPKQSLPKGRRSGIKGQECQLSRETQPFHKGMSDEEFPIAGRKGRELIKPPSRGSCTTYNTTKQKGLRFQPEMLVL